MCIIKVSSISSRPTEWASGQGQGHPWPGSLTEMQNPGCILTKALGDSSPLKFEKPSFTAFLGRQLASPWTCPVTCHSPSHKALCPLARHIAHLNRATTWELILTSKSQGKTQEPPHLLKHRQPLLQWMSLSALPTLTPALSRTISWLISRPPMHAQST